MVNIAFIPNNGLGGVIRGHQIAKYLGRKINPTNDDKNYTHIYIKQEPSNQWPDGSYLDILDGLSLRDSLISFPNIKVICFTQSSRDYLSRFLHREAIYIPQHHCNFERYLRPPRDVRVVGFCGSRTSLAFYRKYPFNHEDWIKAFADADLEFRYKVVNKNTSREDVVAFYKEIDIQIYARYTRFVFHRFKDQLKIINAGSFGIPSVNNKEHVIHADLSLNAENMEEMINKCIYLRDNPAFYEDISQKLKLVAEQYHIQNIAKYYLELENNK